MRLGTARRIANCCRSLAQAGLIAGVEGNVSVRLASDRVLVTPTGLIKSELTAGDIVEVDLSGNKLFGAHLPTSELDMHLRILRARSDVGAVVHAHPPVTIGFGIAGIGFDGFELPELIFSMGRVPLVPFGIPGTPELGDVVEPFVSDHDAMVLANHGAVTMGQTLDIARIRMESLEQAARMIFAARLLGTASPHKQSEGDRQEAGRHSGDLPSLHLGHSKGETEE